jgi:hypothetical protein
MSNVASFRRIAWLALPFFRREGVDDLLKARIAAERVPQGEQLKHAVARGYAAPYVGAAVTNCCNAKSFSPAQAAITAK